MSAHTILSHRRRGVSLVATLVTMPLMLGFVGLAVDVGMSRSLQADLRRTADAAALAAVQDLSGIDPAASMSSAQATVLAYLQKNPVYDGTPVHLDPLVDIVFGQGNMSPNGTGKVDFQPNAQRPDVIKVTVHATLDYTFAKVLGLGSRDLSASATAVLLPRDISVVIDLSGSMRFDSMMYFRDSRSVNTRDIWAALDGPAPSRPYIPGPEAATEYANDSGPALGIMTEWGDHLDSGSYNPASDPGLWYFPMGQSTSNPAVLASLQSRGYSPAQIATITSSTGNSSEWRGRTAVMVGLAEWNSNGGSDSSVNELTWAPYPSSRVAWTWSQYLDWIRDSGLPSAYSAFRYRLGPKTYTEFLLYANKYPSRNDFSQTPQQPLRAVKDAVQTLVDTVGQLDHVSLETFNQLGYHEVDLSADRQAVADRLYELQSNHNERSTTNIGDGLQKAVDELSSARNRSTARKVIVLMSDGASNTGPNAADIAQIAADQNMRIYTVSVGFGADRNMMQQIATIGDGQEFYAAGAPNTYTAQLQQIFRTIGGLRQAVLID